MTRWTYTDTQYWLVRADSDPQPCAPELHRMVPLQVALKHIDHRRKGIIVADQVTYELDINKQ